MNTDSDLFRDKLTRLCENYRIPDGAARLHRMDTYAVVVAPDRVTEDVFRTAVADCITYWQGGMPEAAEFRMMLLDAEKELADEAQAADALRLTLPAPAPEVDVDVTQPPKRFPTEQWDRHVAIGKARQRKRNERVKAWRTENANGWPPDWPEADFHPTEAEVDTALRAMHAAGSLRGDLATAIAARVPIALGLGGEPFLREGGVETTNEPWPDNVTPMPTRRNP